VQLISTDPLMTIGDVLPDGHRSYNPRRRHGFLVALFAQCAEGTLIFSSLHSSIP
jgi:hypothetical protein